MYNVRKIYRDKKSVKNFSDQFKVNADILQDLFSQLNANSRENNAGNSVLYEMPDANLTNGYDPVTKNGAMGAATITQVGSYDNVVVGASSPAQDSYFRMNRIFSAKPILGHLRIKVKALGAVPVIGFRTLGPGGPYSNFTNPVRAHYVNLLTGAITSSSTSGYVVTQQNQFSGAVAVDEVVDVYYEFKFQSYYKLWVVRNNLNGEQSTYQQTIATLTSSGEAQDLIYLGMILGDGTYQILKAQIATADYYNNVCSLFGDSLMSGARIFSNQTIAAQLQAQLGTKVGQFAAGTTYLAGMQSVLRDLLASRPRSVLFDNGLDALQSGYCNPANPNHATWSAAFNGMVNQMIQNGIEPILYLGSNKNVIYTDATLALFKAYWIANYPTRKYVEITASEVFFDGTGFHYNAVTNGIIVERLIPVLEELNLI